MQKYATILVQKCDKCQRFANVPKIPMEELVLIVGPWPFTQCRIDIVRPLPMGKGQIRFLVVVIDYFTKWVEVKPLAKITKKNNHDFTWRSIFYWFGIPQVIINDNGKQFKNTWYREFYAEFGIKNHFSSPAHPQANSQVEVTNRTLLGIINKRLDSSKGLWPEELLRVLWGYRTMMRTPIGEMPFSLAFGTKVVIFIEIGMNTHRAENFDSEKNEEGLRVNFNLLVEKIDQVVLQKAACK